MPGGNESLVTKVSRFHSTTDLSPAEMLMSRRPGSAFDLLLPDLKSKVEKTQWTQKCNHDANTRLRSFAPGDLVFTKKL